MAQAGVGGSAARREQWANHENERRMDEYRRADMAWAHDGQVIAWMASATRAGRVDPQSADRQGFALKRGETAIEVLTGCHLVEAKRGAATPVGAHQGFSFQASRGITARVSGVRGAAVPGEESLRIADVGDVVITNKRVVFRGEHTSREWAFPKFVSMLHGETLPLTLMPVSNRQTVSGIAYEAADAPRVRFALELGRALESDDRDGLLDAIAADEVAHAQARPSQPRFVTLEDAPRSTSAGSVAAAVLTGRPGQSRRRRVAHTAVSAIVLLAAVNGIGGAMARSAETALVAQPVAVAASSTSQSRAAKPATPVAAQAAPSPTATPALPPDAPKKIVVGPSPKAPALLPTIGAKVRTGATCEDGTHSTATGSGACSRHGGVATWIYDLPDSVVANIVTNEERKDEYAAALKKWKAATERKALLADYPCSQGPYLKGKAGYASWRDTNHNGIACD